MREKNSPRKITMNLIQNVRRNHVALLASKQGVRFVEVATLAPMFEKSAIEHKPQSKLLIFKNIVDIATFNVRTIYLSTRSGHTVFFIEGYTPLSTEYLLMRESSRLSLRRNKTQIVNASQYK